MEKISFRSPTGKLRHMKRVLKTTVGKNPHIVGAGIGGAVGGGLGYAEGAYNEKHHKTEVKRGLRFGKKGSTILNGIAGAALGGSIGLNKKMDRDWNKDFARSNRQWHSDFKKKRQQWSDDFNSRWNRSSDEWRSRGFHSNANADAPPPSWAKGAKTKAEAKTRYRAEAKKHHPDHGGDAEKMKKVNTEWEAYEKSKHFDKLAGWIPSLIDELQQL
jgi:hypothetical protein